MLDNYYAVAEVAEILECPDELVVVPLVEADGGSSRTYMTPTRPAPIWLASLILCDSPPESVSAERESVR